MFDFTMLHLLALYIFITCNVIMVAKFVILFQYSELAILNLPNSFKYTLLALHNN